MRKEERERLNEVLNYIRSAEYILKDAKKIIREVRENPDYKVPGRLIQKAEHLHYYSIDLVDSIE